jgi:hypothetical protein
VPPLATLPSLPVAKPVGTVVEPATPTLEPVATTLPAVPLPNERLPASGLAVAAEPPSPPLQPFALPLHSLSPPLHSPSPPFDAPGRVVPPRAGVLELLGPGLERVGRVLLGRSRRRGKQAGGDDGEQPSPAEHEILPRLAPLVWTLE